jgi:hypothetical protein
VEERVATFLTAIEHVAIGGGVGLRLQEQVARNKNALQL